MAEIDKLFTLMVQQNASDMHLSSGSPPLFRVHGEMQPLEMPALENEAVQALVFEILNEKHKKSFLENWELDTSYHVHGVGRFRVNVFMQRRGMGAVFRVIPEKILQRGAELLNNFGQSGWTSLRESVLNTVASLKEQQRLAG